MTTFLQEEIAIMAMYRTDSKEHLLSDLTEAAPHIDDLQMASLVSGILKKLQIVTDADFQQMEFMPDTL